MIVAADPRHRPGRIDAGENTQAAQHGSGPAHPAVAGNFDQFPSPGAPMEVSDGGEDLRLVDGQSEVLPADDSEGPGGLWVVISAAVEVEREVWLPGPLRRDQVEPPLRQDDGAVRQSHWHVPFSTLERQRQQGWGVADITGFPCPTRAGAGLLGRLPGSPRR